MREEAKIRFDNWKTEIEMRAAQHGSENNLGLIAALMALVAYLVYK